MKRVIRITAWQVFGLLLSLSLGIAGLCLIGGCLYIYFGEGAYSRELVATVFRRIAIPVWIAVTLSVGGIVAELLSPVEAEIRKSPKAYDAMLKRLYDTRLTGTQSTALFAEQRRRRNGNILRLLTALIGLLVFFGYAVQPVHYAEDINASVIRAMWVAIPCAALPLVTHIITAHQSIKSFERELAILKSCEIIASKKDVPPATAVAPTRRIAVTVLLIVAAIAAAVIGFLAGGTTDVLTKAINICTECIGLG